MQRRSVLGAVQEGAREREGRAVVEDLPGEGAQVALVVGELEVHQPLRGRPRIRSAMMFFWICALPP